MDIKTSIDTYGRVTIPSEVRMAIGLQEGTELDLIVVGGKIVLAKRNPLPDYIKRLEALLDDVKYDPELDKQVMCSLAKGLEDAIRGMRRPE
jgi:AbrB family looped-hinge helix DNA binding protein